VSKYSAGRYWYRYVRQTVTRFSVMFCYEINIYSRFYYAPLSLPISIKAGSLFGHFELCTKGENHATKCRSNTNYTLLYIFHTWLGEINVQDRKVNKREKSQKQEAKKSVQLLA
jgi:hypothetical protein